MTLKQKNLMLGGIVLFGFYVWRAAPAITVGDAAELSAVGGTLGIAHSPGYPLYSLLTRLGNGLLPFGTTAYRTNVQSALWTAGSVTAIGFCLLDLTGSLGVALLTGLILGCGRLWMGQALVTEVFGLNSFLAAVLLFLTLLPRSLPYACLSAFLLGLGLGNSHTLILIVPVLAIASGSFLSEQPLKTLLLLVGFGLLGMSIYLFIPLRAHLFPLMNWEEPATWERFWKLFTRARYGSFQLAQGSVTQITWEDIVMQLRYVGVVCWENFGPWCLAIPWGVWAGRKLQLPGRVSPVISLLTAFLFSGPLFLIWTHLHVSPRTRGILDRFMYLPLVPASVLLGIGLHNISQGLRRWRIHASMTMAALALTGFLWTQAQALPYERNNLYVWDMGRDLLRNTPPGTLLFSDRADEAEFALAYFQRAEHRRPDVHFIDCNAGVSTSIYGPGYYDIWGRPRLAIRTAEERQRIAAWNGPVYYATYDPQMIPITRVQEGLLYAVPGKGIAHPRFPWNDVFVYRRPARHQGRLISSDRSMYAGYLDLLAQQAYQSHDTQRYLDLYHGVNLNAHP